MIRCAQRRRGPGRRFEARWKLGTLLAKGERAPVGREKKASAGTTRLLARLDLDKQTAMEAQRIGADPRRAHDRPRCLPVAARTSAVATSAAKDWSAERSTIGRREQLQMRHEK